MLKYIVALSSLLSIGCLEYQKDVPPVTSFELNKYLGTWYEIARLDHSFERGLEKVTATYSLREDGGVDVLNKGYHAEDKEWNEAHGRAYFVEGEDTGYLKVSFFRPFYGAYVIFELGPEYQYSFVTSSSKEYLWFLSRTPTVDESLKTHFLKEITARGFPSDEVIFVNQE